MTHTQTGVMRTGWPGAFAEETNERARRNGQPQGWVHVTERSLLFTFVYKDLPILIIAVLIFQRWPKRYRFFQNFCCPSLPSYIVQRADSISEYLFRNNRGRIRTLRNQCCD